MELLKPPSPPTTSAGSGPPRRGAKAQSRGLPAMPVLEGILCFPPSLMMFLQAPSHLLGCIPSSNKYPGGGEAFDLHRTLGAHCDWSAENIYKATRLMAPCQVSLRSNMGCWLCKSPCTVPRMGKEAARHQRRFLRPHMAYGCWSTGCDGGSEHAHKQMWVFSCFIGTQPCVWAHR